MDLETLTADLWLKTDLRHNEARRAVLSAIEARMVDLSSKHAVHEIICHYNDTHERQIAC